MIYPYLLRGLAAERPNHVWAMDITYIPMARGFVYLAAVVDWSLDVFCLATVDYLGDGFCIEAVEEALGTYGRPEIFNTDPRQPVHQRQLHRPAAGQQDRHQHGWPRLMAGQRICRAAVAVGQI
jgi:hypothetical protein